MFYSVVHSFTCIVNNITFDLDKWESSLIRSKVEKVTRDAFNAMPMTSLLHCDVTSRLGRRPRPIGAGAAYAQMGRV